MRYEIQFKSSAWETLQSLEKDIQRRIRAAILELVDTPRPTGAKRLSGKEPFYRIRVGSYRVIYEIQAKEVVVVVLKIGHRRDVYRKT